MDKLKVYENFLEKEIREKTERNEAMSKGLPGNFLSGREISGILRPYISELKSLKNIRDKLYEMFPGLKNYSKEE